MNTIVINHLYMTQLFNEFELILFIWLLKYPSPMY